MFRLKQNNTDFEHITLLKTIKNEKMQAASQIPANIVPDTPQADLPFVGSRLTRQAHRRYVANTPCNVTGDKLNGNI